MVRTVQKHVRTSVMDVTTSMVIVIEGVYRAGRETTVKNVMQLQSSILDADYILFLSRLVTIRCFVSG